MSDNMNEMTASSWIDIVVLATSPFIAFAIISCIISCFACSPHGFVIMRKMGPCMRTKVVESSIVTTAVRRVWDYRMCNCCAASPPTYRARREPTSACIPATDDNEIIGETGEDYSKCSICLEPFKLGQSVSFARTTMYCNHCFHTDCLKKWLMKKTTCPCCRQSIIRWEDLFVRCKSWNTLFSRRSRRIVLLIQQHKDLLVQCRETGKFCIKHGLLFPYNRPTLEPPYEPRARDMLEMLIACNEVPRLRSAIASQLRHQHNINNQSDAQSPQDQTPRLREMRRRRQSGRDENDFPTIIHAVNSEIPCPIEVQTLTTSFQHDHDPEIQDDNQKDKNITPSAKEKKSRTKGDSKKDVSNSSGHRIQEIKHKPINAQKQTQKATQKVEPCDENHESISAKINRGTEMTITLDDSKVSCTTATFG